jgi:hypothetical protein
MTKPVMPSTDISDSLAALSQINHGQPATILTLINEFMRSTSGLQAVIHSIMIDRSLRTGGISFSLVPISSNVVDGESTAKVSATTRFIDRLSKLSARPRLEERKSTNWTGKPPPEDIEDIVSRIEGLYGDHKDDSGEQGSAGTAKDSLLTDIQSWEETYRDKLGRQEVQESFQKVLRGILAAYTNRQALEGCSEDFTDGRVYALPMVCDTEWCCVSSGTRVGKVYGVIVDMTKPTIQTVQTDFSDSLNSNDKGKLRYRSKRDPVRTDQEKKGRKCRWVDKEYSSQAISMEPAVTEKYEEVEEPKESCLCC